MGTSYQIHLFGQPAAFDQAGTAVAGLGPGKPFALLSYLLVEGDSARDELIALLWGDVPEAKARNAFRQALHRLRAALGENVIPHDPDLLSISGTAGIDTDVAAFERLLDSGNPDAAIAAYSGDFLSGLAVNEPAFDAWLESTRKRYRARFRDALRSGVQRDLEAGEIGRALERAALLAESDHADPDGAILYATTLLGAGRRAEALNALDQFERRHQEELGSPAGAGIREFAARLRRGPSERDVQRPGRARASFVGRESELALLLAQIRSLESGKGSLLMLEGEPGIGKTRLIDEFFLRASDLGSPLLLLGRERAAGAGIPFASIAEALRGALDAPGVSGTGQHLLAEAARLLPQLRDQFSLPPISDIVDDAGRVRFYEGIAALLDSVAYEQPVCIALDDFHNCSTATLGLVQYLIDRLRAAPILFVLVARATPAFGAIRRRLLEAAGKNASAGNATSPPAVILLEALDDAASRQLARELTGPASSDETIDQIVAAGGGFPYKIAQLAEKGLTGESLGTTPLRLRDVLWARLQRCTQAEQRLFVAAALLDRPVSIRLLAAASHLPEKGALDAALALEREGLLLQRADGMTPAHDFAGELALEGTGPAGRALLAGWAAEALERDGSGTAAELATLFSLAGRRELAFKYSRTAGYAAAAAGAATEARNHFETALGTAPSELDRSEIETILGAFGREVPRLPGFTDHSTAEKKSRLETDAWKHPPATPPGGKEHGPSNSIANEQVSWRSRALIIASLAIIILVTIRAVGESARLAAPGIALADTLLVAEEIDPRDTVIAFTTGPLGFPLSPMPGATRHGPARLWIDSLRVPWTNPLSSPDGQNVAVERITKIGSDLYVISSDKLDTIPLHVGKGDDFSADWSPDGRWLLCTHGETRSNGIYGVGLYAYSLNERGRRIAFDTSAAHDVVSAAWSPDGSHVAWTARFGPQHQQDLFISDAGGENAVNLSDDPAEDYSLAWSPDGRRLAFTSERSGRAELYSIDIATREIRRLTWDGAHADHAIFSPDGRWLAYETTREGMPAVYVMPAWGGTGRTVAPAQPRVTLLGWRGREIQYVDRLSIDVPQLSGAGDTGTVVVRALDRHGQRLPLGDIRVSALDPGFVRVRGPAQPSDSDLRAKRIPIEAVSRGLARFAVSAGNWRADTAFISIGSDTLTLLADNFDAGLSSSRWHRLGVPPAKARNGAGKGGSRGLVTESGREWESGVLSAGVFPIREGLVIHAWVKAPLNLPASAAKSFTLALVAADPADVLDSVAPKFLRLAAVSWLAPAGRLSYSVGREIFTEPVSRTGSGDSREVGIEIGPDSRVSFLINGVSRWTSTLRLRTIGENSRAQLWLGSQTSGNEVAFDDIAILLKTNPKVR
jgi:DNA-binding SARP family transcriptional activator